MDLKERQFRPVEVTPRPGEDIERLVKRFTRKVRDEGILQELYERRSYRKPSEKRRAKISRARYVVQNAKLANES